MHLHREDMIVEPDTFTCPAKAVAYVLSPKKSLSACCYVALEQSSRQALTC